MRSYSGKIIDTQCQISTGGKRIHDQEVVYVRAKGIKEEQLQMESKGLPTRSREMMDNNVFIGCVEWFKRGRDYLQL